MNKRVLKIINKPIFLFIIFLLLIFFNSGKVYAAEGDIISSGSSGDCTYEIVELSDGTYKVTISGNGDMGSYSSSNSPFYTYRSYISEVYVGSGVTSIGTYVFRSCSSLTSIDLSDCTSLTSIGNYAFSGCSSITSIDLSTCTLLTSIGSYAFRSCSSITSIDLSGCTALTSIGSYAFSSCSSLTSIDLSNCAEITSISGYTFYGCSSLESLENIKLYDWTKITSIGKYAFGNCTGITNIDLSNCTALTSIVNYAFYGCSSLTSLDLSNCTALTSIYSDAFYGCSSLTSVDLSNCTALEDINNSNVFYGCSSLTSIDLSNCTALLLIGEKTFYGCSSLTSIDLSDCTALTEIGNYAFYGCSSLTSIDLSACTALTEIGYSTFSSCSSITSIDLSNCKALTSIDMFAFSSCSSLTNIDLSNCTALTSIGTYAFSNCSNIISVDFSNCKALTSMYNRIFYGCSNLTSVNLSNCTALTSIVNYAFYECSSLTSIDLSNCTALTSISGSAFTGCSSLTNIDLSDLSSLTTINDYAFSYCSSLTSIDLSACTLLTSIGRGTFAHCSSLTNIDLSTCTLLTSIGSSAFSSCSSLTSLDLSACTEITSISSNTFYSCSSLESVYLYDWSQITSINEYAFYGCCNLEPIDFTYLTSLTYIGDSAFEYCIKFTEIDLSKCTLLYYVSGFGYCVNITSIDLSGCTLLTDIGNYAFYECENLTSVKFPDSLEQIYSYAFDYTGLKEIDLSNCSNLTYIGKYAFSLWYDNHSEDVDIYLPSNTLIYMGTGALWKNREKEGWAVFYAGYYYVDDLGVAYYYDSDGAYLAFVPSGITSLEVPDVITIDETDYDVIGVLAFSISYAGDLEEITFKDNSKITYLDYYAFAYCENLSVVQGYSTVDEIIENVFSNATIEDKDTLFECTGIKITYDFIVKVDFDYYEYFTFSTEIDDVTEITLQLYCDGEIIEEVTLSKDEIDGSTYTFNDLEVGHEYYVDVKHNLKGWGVNISYYYASNSVLTYEWINIERINAYTVNIEWNDEESTGNRPTEVQVILYDEDGNVWDIGTFNEENNWSYTFYVNTDTSAFTTSLSYTATEYTTTVIAEDSIIEADVVSYDVSYEDADAVSWTSCIASYTPSSVYYSGATISLTYTEMEPVLESSVEKSGQTEITSSNEEITYNITYEAEIDEYKGDVSLILVDTLPYKINEEESDLDGGVYDEETKTITWEESVDTVNTFSTDESATILVTKTITVLYEDIELEEESFTNKIVATIDLLAMDTATSPVTETVEDEQDTLINVTGSVIVKYIDLITQEEIEEPVEITGKIGTTYDITDNEKEIEGYTLVEEPTEKTGIYTQETRRKNLLLY